MSMISIIMGATNVPNTKRSINSTEAPLTSSISGTSFSIISDNWLKTILVENG